MIHSFVIMWPNRKTHILLFPASKPGEPPSLLEGTFSVLFNNLTQFSEVLFKCMRRLWFKHSGPCLTPVFDISVNLFWGGDFARAQPHRLGVVTTFNSVAVS